MFYKGSNWSIPNQQAGCQWNVPGVNLSRSSSTWAKKQSALFASVSSFALPVRDEPLILGERDRISVRCEEHAEIHTEPDNEERAEEALLHYGWQQRNRPAWAGPRSLAAQVQSRALCLTSEWASVWMAGGRCFVSGVARTFSLP
jgi:hypothetical protein